MEQLWRFRLVNLSMGLHLMEYTVPSFAWCAQILDDLFFKDGTMVGARARGLGLWSSSCLIGYSLEH